MYFDLNTKKSIQMLKSIISHWNKNIKIDETNGKENENDLDGQTKRHLEYLGLDICHLLRLFGTITKKKSLGRLSLRCLENTFTY